MACIQVPKKGTFTCASSTAEEAVEYLRQVLDEPWHGNVLLSCGPHKLEPKQRLQEFNADFVFANYSWLSSGPPIHIAETELRGITIEQLSSLLVFIEDIASSWCDAHHLAYGQPLSVEAFNLYHADFWIIGPATAGHERGGCSYVELVASSASTQRPLWFVSHAWLEPVVKFVACLKRQASLRQLSDQTAYWVCAYANNQHQLQNEICNNPRKTSFYRAIQLCAGVLLVLDQNATPFTRIWCCFEESIAVEEREKGSPLLLDVAATEDGCAHVITDGLAGSEQQMIPLLGFLAKSQREAEFPIEILMKGLDVNIAAAMASKDSDKQAILNALAFPRAGTKILQQEAQATHESYEAVGRALAGHFALANWFSSVANGLDTFRLLTALQNDDKRRMVQLSLTGCRKFDYFELRRFLQHLPPQLQVLRLDLGFTAVRLVELDAPLPELQELSLRLVKMPLRQVHLQRSMMPKLRSLHLWLSTLPELEDLPLDVDILRLQELVLHVHNCPKLPKNTKQALYDTVHPWPWHNADKWISIDEAEPSWFQLFQRGDAASGSPADDVVKSTKFEAAKFQDASDMPFPCSHANCSNFHDNTHGYCQKHRWSLIWKKASSTVVKTRQWLELIFLLTIQAAAEIQSRLLLVLMMVSLLPATCIFLEQSTGMPVASASTTCLVVAVGSCFYSAKRLDAMQQCVFRLAIATEAQYFQVLEARDTGQHLVQVSTMANHSGYSGASSVQTVQRDDLKTNYLQAKRYRSLFQTSVCDPLASIGLEVDAKIKLITELDEKEAAVDVLHCEVVCESLQQVQLAWDVLKNLDVEIESSQDFFLVTSSRKCLKVVVSLQGYLATVVLLEKSLSSLEALGISEVANSLGLLDKTTVATWEVGLQGVSSTPKCILVATILLRLVAFSSSLLIALQIHFMGYPRWSMWRFAMSSPFWVCSGILLWEMCALQILPKNFRTRPRPTQVWYTHYFGVQGCHYAFKVAALQFLTVLMQGIAKASLFHTIQDTYGSEVLQGNTAVQCFMVLLLCNIMFPAMILANPNSSVSRVAAALLDAVLDVGYLVTSLWMYVGFASEYLEDIFLHSFWNYVSIYICAAHVLCVCKSLETADWVALFQVPRATPTLRLWKRMLFTAVYTSALMTFVGILLGGVFFGNIHQGLCPPCKCSTVAPASLLLERCVIPTGYVALAAADMLEFNLTHRNITQVLPYAFLARGAHKSVRYVSLRGNHLTELPDKLFCDLLQVEHAEHEWDMETVDLSQNRLTVLPPGIFQAGSFRELPWIRELHLESNRLTTLPARVFEGLTVKQLHLQNNKLTQLHAESFRGLKLENGILDMSRNKLQTLPPNVFEGLEVKQLHLQNNSLIQLHSESFSGLRLDYGYGILDLSGHKLQTLPPKVFAGLEVLHLYLQNNKLIHLHAESFSGLKLRGFTSSILDISQNKLQTLPPNVFESLEVGDLYLQDNDLKTLPARVFEGLRVEQLHLQSNNLTQLHAESFRGLKLHYGILDMSRNKLQTLPPRVFAGLTVKQLHLQNNKLIQLHAESFSGLRLDYGILDMSSNKLQTLPPRVFAGLTVKQLHMQNNNLTQLHAESFSGLEIFRTTDSILDISHNKLQTLPPNLFESDLCPVLCFASLHVLNLAHNELSEVPDFQGLLNLHRLKLEGNRLQRLHQKTLRRAGRWERDSGTKLWYEFGLPLEDLNLEQNQLVELHPDCFVYYSELRENLLELKLGGNRLTALPESLFSGRQGLSKLRTLELQSNRLVQLPQQIFQNLTHLQSLNLSQNKLEELPLGLFHGLGLTIIDLSHNDLTVVDAQLFDLEKLTTLDLRGNPLTESTRRDLARLTVELHVD